MKTIKSAHHEFPCLSATIKLSSLFMEKTFICQKDGLVTFNILKTKLVTFHYLLDPEVPPVTMNGCPLHALRNY